MPTPCADGETDCWIELGRVVYRAVEGISRPAELCEKPEKADLQLESSELPCRACEAVKRAEKELKTISPLFVFFFGSGAPGVQGSSGEALNQLSESLNKDI